jgi:integrase
MVELQKSRAIRVFESYLHSSKTITTYSVHLTSFVKWAKIPAWDILLDMNTKELKNLLEDYFIELKTKGRTAIYCKNISFAIQAFLEANDYEGINWKKLRKLIGKDEKKRNSRPWTNDEIKRMLEVARSLRNKALILFLSSSGVRRGSIPQMKMKHLKEMPLDCKSVTVYSETVDEYTTFINAEASRMLESYFERRKAKGEILTTESYVFASNHSTRIEIPVTDGSISYLIEHIKEQAGLKSNTMKNQVCHAFRRRFDTVFKLRTDCNLSLTERLMGHSTTVQLDNRYFQPTIDDLFKEYQKGMGDLTIDENERLKAENEKIKEDLDELQLQQQTNNELRKRLDDYEQNQTEILKVMNLVQNGQARLKNNSDGEIHVMLTGR